MSELPLELETLRAEATSVPATARTMPIEDDETFHAAGAILVRIKTLRTTLALLFNPHIKRAFDAHRALVEDRRRLDAPLADAEAVLKARLTAFTIAEDERRAIEARRHAAEAEAERTARVWTEVDRLEAAGYHAEAADLVEDFVQEPTRIVVTPMRVAAPGLAARDVWRYDVVDPSLVPREFWTIDHTKLGGVVRALKRAAAIPGVRVWVERTIAATGR
jgi:hypothetical protein